MDNAVIYDFETLSQNPIDAALISCAMLSFDMELLKNNGYTYEELLSKSQYIKLDVQDQVKNWNRKVDPATVEWWSKQDKGAISKIKPSKDDVPLSEFLDWFVDKSIDNKQAKFYFTRNNTFDPVILQSICTSMKEPMPYIWWKIRDTKSFILGLSYELNIRDDFIPPDCEGKYVKHDPRHDVVLDVMRMQILLHSKFGE